MNHLATIDLVKVADGISLILTSPTVILGIGVVWLWRHAAIEAATVRLHRTSTQWIILGVAVAFLGDALDNIFWGLAWSAHFVDSDWTSVLFNSGVYFNIPFRQIAGTVAAYCHLRAFAEKAQDEELKQRINRAAAISLIAGVFYVLVLHRFQVSSP
ncbi:MAG: hypothetical protein Fues2KO_47440 [Fuerstiella sp.]